MLGIHKQSYYLKENGKREFTISEAKKLAKIFDCTLDDLFGGENWNDIRWNASVDRKV